MITFANRRQLTDSARPPSKPHTRFEISSTRGDTTHASDMSVGAGFRVVEPIPAKTLYNPALSRTRTALMDFVSTLGLTYKALDGSITARTDFQSGRSPRFLGRI